MEGVYIIASVIVVSLVSLVGAISLPTKKLRKSLIYVVSFSAGALLGDSFLHLVPEIYARSFLVPSLFVLLGIMLFFSLEKIIHWQHCHKTIYEKNHVHPLVVTNLVGDGLHNFIDGMLIAATYLASLPAGIATTIAVILHEIPQEIGDYGVLLHAGLSKKKALALNFLSALLALAGAIVVMLAQNLLNLAPLLVPITAGGFIYIATADLIPEIHKHSQEIKTSLLQLLSLSLGIGVMYLLTFLA
ncbi:ZIP family metal transporter [Candidatus Pacearchaeota archaeon]|nr:MAG: ZIP family metal transporter [Candidatus Pacearchaeota archaeon]